ncbi:MAG: Rrf2 family transcriptional regulator [Deltaproteobacteria bacterium]|nr:Rrf2 family transcriptional regulator [Deltaproteobacteria bacterium]
MKLTAAEEYGLRIVVRIAASDGLTTIGEIAEGEGLTVPYVAKLTGVLRRAGMIRTVRGKAGGLELARSADRLPVADVLQALGGTLFPSGFCEGHSGGRRVCANDTDCSIRTLWTVLDAAVSRILSQLYVSDLLCTERQMERLLERRASARLPMLPETS